MSSVIESLEKISDPRDQKKVTYPLPSILFMSICSIFSGAESWDDIVTWSEINKDWLSEHVDMSQGVPCYSTIRRVFRMISPLCWGQLIQNTVLNCHPNKVPENHVAIDGKTLRGTKCSSKDIRAIQMVHAWSVNNNIILGEVKTDSKSNEITAIPLLLELLDLQDSTISIDAIGCNEKIITTILAQGANYVIGLKNNQPKLYDVVTEYIHNNISSEYLIEDHYDKSHARTTRRRYFSFNLPSEISHLGFSEMKTVIATETISTSKYKQDVTSEWRYYITNHGRENNKLHSYIRNHWQVESMHWCLDVHLNDDRDKKYEENAAENFAKTKRFLLNLVKSIPPEGKKRSLRSNLKKVGWDLNYLVKLLFS